MLFKMFSKMFSIKIQFLGVILGSLIIGACAFVYVRMDLMKRRKKAMLERKMKALEERKKKQQIINGNV